MSSPDAHTPRRQPVRGGSIDDTEYHSHAFPHSSLSGLPPFMPAVSGITASTLSVPLPLASGPVGLSAFFGGLAAGEETAILVQILRRTFLRHTAAVTDDTPTLTSSSYSGERSEENLEVAVGNSTADTSKHDCSGCASAGPSPCTKYSATSASDDESAAMRSAARMAMLLGLEHPAAAEEATYLYFTPSTHTHLGGGFPVRGGRLRALLSDCAVVKLARRCLHERGDAVTARALLDTVDVTPPVAALRIACAGRLGDWQAALAALESIPPAMWTEIDVALTVRVMYHAVKAEHDDQHRKKATHRRERHDGLIQERYTIPLSLLRTAREHGVCCGSPTAINDALGLLSLGDKSALWHHAVELLETTLLPSRKPLPELTSAGEPKVSHPHTPLGESFSRAAPLPSSHIQRAAPSDEITAFYPSDVDGPFFVDGPPHMRGGAGTLEGEDITSSGSVRRCSGEHHSDSKSPSLLRPNAITVYQTCRALRGRPDLAFRYATDLVRRYDVRVTLDGRATEAYLRACVRSGEWETALALIRERSTRTASAAAPTPEDAESHPSHGTFLNSRGSHQQQLYSPDLLLSLIRLLGEHPAASRAYQELLASMFDPSASNSSFGDLAWELSKHYNPDTVSRAYNTMVQHATTVDEAERVYAALAQVVGEGPGPSTPTAAGTESSGGVASASPSAKATTVAAAKSSVPGRRSVKIDDSCNHKGNHSDDKRLENESYERFAVLYAQAGDWERALGCLNTLLYHPRRRKVYIPTTAIHDTIQYALEQSSTDKRLENEAASSSATVAKPQSVVLTGAPWQASVALFQEMCDRQVPASTVAFQSVVKRCFAQGVPDEAQRVFRLLMRHGVRR